MRTWWIPIGLVAMAACGDNNDTGVVLEAPSSLSSVSLDRAIALTWSDNSYINDPDFFENYRVYSTSYDIDNDDCGTEWKLEGTTVAPEFLAGALTNGIPRCFSVTAASNDGTESARSPLRNDTPRPDARNVVLYARQAQDAGSGFRFWDDLNDDGVAQDGELGIVRSGSVNSIDFSVERDLNGDFFFNPVRAETGVELYSGQPVDDLTSIDFAPSQTYHTTDIEALPGYGYVFEMSASSDNFKRYGAIRVTHVGVNFLIMDWAFQTDPGNPELRQGMR